MSENLHLFDIRNRLLEYFHKNNTFEPNKDLDKIFPLTINKDRDLAALIATLQGMEKDGLISEAKGEKTYYILVKPFAMFRQGVELNGETTQAIAKVVNDYCSSHGDTANLTNPFNIQEDDIQKLTVICHNLFNSSKQEEQLT